MNLVFGDLMFDHPVNLPSKPLYDLQLTPDRILTLLVPPVSGSL